MGRAEVRHNVLSGPKVPCAAVQRASWSLFVLGRCLADADPARIHRPQGGRIQMRTLAAASTIHVTNAATQVNSRNSLKIVI
jgi:hypothetical protein